MSVSIVEILSGDKGFDLQNGHWIRPWSFGTSWTTIRIGARIHFPVSSGALLTGTPELWFGLCNGTTNAPGAVAAASVDHALFWQSIAASWSYQAVAGYISAAASGSQQVRKIVGGTSSTVAVTGISYVGAISSAPAVRRACMVVTITKGSPNYTVALSRATSTTGGGDNTYSQLLQAMELSDPADAMTGTCTTHSNTIAIDEGTDGTLDHVFIRWNRTTVPCYVSEVLVARVA